MAAVDAREQKGLAGEALPHLMALPGVGHHLDRDRTPGRDVGGLVDLRCRSTAQRPREPEIGELGGLQGHRALQHITLAGVAWDRGYW